MDPAARRGLLIAGMQHVRQAILVLPLHRQVIPWATRANVKVFHRPDNVVEPLWTSVN
jgi:peptide/nickel transport system substrate-binding protein